MDLINVYNIAVYGGGGGGGGDGGAVVDKYWTITSNALTTTISGQEVRVVDDISTDSNLSVGDSITAVGDISAAAADITGTISAGGQPSADGITTQGVVAASLTIVKDSIAHKLFIVDTASNYVAIGGDQYAIYTMTANGSAYIANGLLIGGQLGLTGDLDISGIMQAGSVKGDDIHACNTIYATNGIETEGPTNLWSDASVGSNIPIFGNIELTGRSLITLSGQSIVQWQEVQNYFNQTSIHKRILLTMMFRK
jgi:hypothetical protein